MVPTLPQIATMERDDLLGWWLLNMQMPRSRPLTDGELHAVLVRARQLGVELHKQGRR